MKEILSFTYIHNLTLSQHEKFLLLAALAASSSTYAQTSRTDTSVISIFKPASKNWSTKLNINLFKGELSLNNAVLKQPKS